MPSIKKYNRSSGIVGRAARLLNVFGWSLIVMSASNSISFAKSNDRSQEQFDAAATLFTQGEFGQAATLWRELASQRGKTDRELRMKAAIGAAAACQRMGLYAEAESELKKVEVLLSDTRAAVAAQYHQQLGNVRMSMHQYSQSLEAFSRAATLAMEAEESAARALILNDYGNALFIAGYSSDALAAFEQSLALSKARSLKSAMVAASLNIARLQMAQEDLSATRAHLVEVDRLLNEIAPDYEWAMHLLALVEIEKTQSTDPKAVPTTRISQLRNAQTWAIEHNNARLASLAFGYEAELQATAKEPVPAELAYRKAIFFAAQAGASDILYRWYWQSARLYRAQDRVADALNAYDQAVHTLTPIRQELLNGYHDSFAFFQKNVRPVYVEYAEAILAHGDELSQASERYAELNRARGVLETLKSAELQDYFRDECVLTQESKSLDLNQVDSHTAVLYPIVLEDRVELLLAVDGELKLRSTQVAQDQVNESALRLREFVQQPGNSRYLPYANRLYRWLIEPIKSELRAAGIDTLVIIPDGALRTIPFAALHSGERYLIEEFALAVTPSLKLTAASTATSTKPNALLAGVAQSVQGFAPLPQVTNELSTIHEQVGGRLLSNREYTKDNLRAALKGTDYGIVHMATHGVVGATPAESFLLTYDGKLTMSDLDFLLRIGEFRKRPVELLTLSACETAVGDERAALGLAGIAVKSGAHSVVASLWLVDDRATAQLMNRFYKALDLRANSPGSKAKALRAAQLSMLNDSADSHPANWAAFTMIGNWQ